MRLEPFCRISTRYVDASWHRPYGSRNRDEEALGFGHGDGAVSGEIEGEIAVRDGNELLLSIHGQSVEESPPGGRRAILARVELTTKAEPYRWLNTCFLVGEGEIDEEREKWWLDTFVCVNEQAQGPPALGADAPARFRQRGGLL